MSEPCAWCDAPSVTLVVIVTGRKNRKTKPVCEDHAKDFESRGIKTTRVEVDERQARAERRNSWQGSGRPWR